MDISLEKIFALETLLLDAFNLIGEPNKIQDILAEFDRQFIDLNYFKEACLRLNKTIDKTLDDTQFLAAIEDIYHIEVKCQNGLVPISTLAKIYEVENKSMAIPGPVTTAVHSMFSTLTHSQLLKEGLLKPKSTLCPTPQILENCPLRVIRDKKELTTTIEHFQEKYKEDMSTNPKLVILSMQDSPQNDTYWGLLAFRQHIDWKCSYQHMKASHPSHQVLNDYFSELRTEDKHQKGKRYVEHITSDTMCQQPDHSAELVSLLLYLYDLHQRQPKEDGHPNDELYLSEPAHDADRFLKALLGETGFQEMKNHLRIHNPWETFSYLMQKDADLPSKMKHKQLTSLLDKIHVDTFKQAITQFMEHLKSAHMGASNQEKLLIILSVAAMISSLYLHASLAAIPSVCAITYVSVGLSYKWKRSKQLSALLKELEENYLELPLKKSP